MSADNSVLANNDADALKQKLHQAVELAALALPPQRGLRGYVTLNPLRAYEHLLFPDALRELWKRERRAPLRPESFYLEAWSRGRILDSDIEASINEAIPDEAWPFQLRPLSLRQYLKSLLSSDLQKISSEAILWRIDETPWLESILPALPRSSAEAILQEGPANEVLRTLWHLCLDLSRPLQEPSPQAYTLTQAGERLGHRTLISTTHAILHRWFAVLLDQGLASWPLAHRQHGLFQAFLQAMDGLGALAPNREVLRLARDSLKQSQSAEQLIISIIQSLDLPDSVLEPFIRASLFDLKGWFGQFAWRQARPDLAPPQAPPVTILDGLAIRFLVEQALLSLAGLKTLKDLPIVSAATVSNNTTTKGEARDAWQLFQMALIAGLTPKKLKTGGAPVRSELRALASRFDTFERRWLWHLAFERRLRFELFDALLAHPQNSQPTTQWQLATCIDDREESLRRHIEEIDPTVETFGVAGFFYLPLQIGGTNPPLNLCPVNAFPSILVQLDSVATQKGLSQRNSLSNRLRGAFISLFGWGAIFPRLADRLWPPAAREEDEASFSISSLPHPQLDPSRSLEDDLFNGLQQTLVEMGLTTNFAPLILVLGHGGESRNNPHAATYHCGACGGGRGAMNARLFAHAINRPDLRARLADAGLRIPSSTHFIGGFHNTTTDHITLFDLQDVPAALQSDLQRIRTTLQKASARNAKERCRRFISAPLDLKPESALSHVADRAIDLAQPRPEYGHATNCYALIGRRAWSRALFLDRRAFLISFDPGGENAEKILQRTMASVAPIGAGINLDYFFSFIDRERFGSGTKLPHNVTAGLGVMNGASSDLRTGLPWQGVEIHEPARLLILIEASPATILSVLENEPGLARLVTNRWVLAAAYQPSLKRIDFFDSEGFRQHIPETTQALTSSNSLQLIAGRRESLKPHSLGATP